MFCDNCGKSIPDSSPACGFCGQLFTAASGEAAIPAPRVSVSYASFSQPADRGPFLVVPAFRSTLGALEKGKIIRAAVALALRIIGGFALLTGVYLVIETLKLAFNLPTTATIGGMLAAALLGAATFAVFQILFYRADSISRLGESSFTVMPIFSLLFRAWGETYAAFVATLGVAGCVFTWFSGMNPAVLLGAYLPVPLPTIPMESNFVVGLIFLIVTALMSFAVLIFFYFLAEAVIVIADIARNVGLLVRASGAPDTVR
jgi:hypothetical protein